MFKNSITLFVYFVAASLNVHVASKDAGGNMEVRLDSLTGTLLGACKIKNTGGLGHWAMQLCNNNHTCYNEKNLSSSPAYCHHRF